MDNRTDHGTAVRAQLGKATCCRSGSQNACCHDPLRNGEIEIEMGIIVTLGVIAACTPLFGKMTEI
jgi:hypothetical protein